MASFIAATSLQGKDERKQINPVLSAETKLFYKFLLRQFLRAFFLPGKLKFQKTRIEW